MANSQAFKPVTISAYSAISHCGYGNAALYQALRGNRSSLAPLAVFEIPFITQVGEIYTPLPSISKDLKVYESRNAQVALAALNHPEDGVRSAIEQSKSRYGVDRIGVVLGTSTSGLYESEAAYAKFLVQHKMPDDFNFVTRHAYQATARFLQKELGLEGPCYAISTACSSSAKAIAAGQRLIVSGVCDAVLVGGVDTLCRLTLRGFKSLDLLSATQCQPMDQQRCGINIGEAGALLVLERSSETTSTKAQLLAVGESSDAYHMSSPHPEGRGAMLAMNKALQFAGLEAGDIDYLNLHATGTRINDQVEALAVYQVFNEVRCSGTKSLTGHTLGAAGALEAVIALLALQHQFIPGTANLENVDKEFNCQVIKNPIENQKLNIVMSNSFGFGGNNASLIIAGHHD